MGKFALIWGAGVAMLMATAIQAADLDSPDGDQTDTRTRRAGSLTRCFRFPRLGRPGGQTRPLAPTTRRS